MISNWGYEGSTGCSNWCKLGLVKGTGKEQSPINIDSCSVSLQQPSDETTCSSIIYSEQRSLSTNDTILKNTGFTLKVIVDQYLTEQGREEKIPSVTFQGKTYKLVQFHFHSPSEHKIDGKPSDFVVHLVHQCSEGTLAVVAVLFNVSRTTDEEDKGENAFLRDVFEYYEKELKRPEEKDSVNEIRFDSLDLDKSYYSYRGSLTTPPCSEGVSWLVKEECLTMSKDQFEKYRHMFPMDTNRPIQQTHERCVTFIR